MLNIHARPHIKLQVPNLFSNHILPPNSKLAILFGQVNHKVGKETAFKSRLNLCTLVSFIHIETYSGPSRSISAYLHSVFMRNTQGVQVEIPDPYL